MAQTNTSLKIHNFFERAESGPAKLVQFIIFLLIIVSVAIVVIEFFYLNLFEAHKLLIEIIGYVVLGVFTVEYILRIATAPAKLKWVRRPLNIVDFVAIFPNYLEFILVTAVPQIAALRVLRLLRFLRILRVFRLVKYKSFFTKIFRYKNTILQSITPVIGLLVAFKGIIWILEYYDLWISDPNIGELFAIIGFALGIVLSQKISASYDKFIQVEETAVQLYGTLNSLKLILNKIKPGWGDKTCQNWLDKFLKLLKDPKANNFLINEANHDLYEVLVQTEDGPAEMATLHGDICRDAAFCLSKKVRLIPKAYDTLLHQSTFLYLVLIGVFIPGWTGVLSIIVATYILYGMYNLTQDFDSIIGGEFNLINIDISELEQFNEELAKK